LSDLNRFFRRIKPFVRIVFTFLEFLGEFKRCFRGISQKIDLSHSKIQFRVKINLRKILNFFQENLTVGAIQLSRCSSKRIVKIVYFFGDLRLVGRLSAARLIWN